MCVLWRVANVCLLARARDFSVASNTRFYYRVDVECTERKIKYQNGQHRSAPHSKSNRTNENEQPVKPEQRTSIVKTHISESLVKQHSRIHTTDDDDDDGIVWPAVAAVTKYSTHEKKAHQTDSWLFDQILKLCKSIRVCLRTRRARSVRVSKSNSVNCWEHNFFSVFFSSVLSCVSFRFVSSMHANCVR